MGSCQHQQLDRENAQCANDDIHVEIFGPLDFSPVSVPGWGENLEKVKILGKEGGGPWDTQNHVTGIWSI